MKRLSSCVTVLLVVSLLAACASRPPAEPIVLRPVVRTAPEPIRHKASFDCTQTSSALQDVICGDTALSSLDRDMFEAYRANLRSVDLVGRMQLVANQRYWLLSRASKCKVSSRRLGGTKPNAANVGCLTSTYRGRIGELKAWPQPSSQPQVRKTDGAGKFHPLSAYVEFRLVDGRDGALCSSLGRQFNNAIADRGEVNFAHINGSTQIAGTHGAAKGSANGVNYSVSLYDAGPYASYQLRAVGLDINGQNVIHDHSMGDWVSQLPNSGGRFGNTSSQTRDYASVDVFQTQQRTFALVSEAWGYYSAAALGESAYAGVYDLGSGSAQPLCLYSTYLTPPITRTSDRLPAFKELEQLLSRMTGEPPQLEMDERRDEGLLERETEWILFNLPLVAIGEIERFGRQAALRQRHDMAIDAIWNWSERNLPSKLLYRRMLPMMQPAYDELLITFQQGQGLKPDEARAAADLVIMDLIDRAAENLSDFYAAKAAPLAPFAQYTPRYAAAPQPGDLERGRKLTTLHSAALNRAPAPTIADFIKYESSTPARSAAGNTPLMAAVRSSETVRQLIDAGFAVNATNDWKKTALMTAAQTNQVESAQILLDAGAELSRATSCWQVAGAGALDNEEGAVSKRTALMYAAGGAGEPLVRLLLDRGAEINQRDAAGRSACEYLADNKVLTEAERASIKPLLCRAGSAATMVASVAAQPCPVNATPAFTAEEARQLGGAVLTAFGAERAGNEDGSIPEYTGSGVKAPAGWDPEKPGIRPDPYDEKPLYSINAQNASRYADKLDGMMEVFRKYPDFRMDIYPTHRDFVFPQHVLDNTIKNAASCKGTNADLKLEGCYGGLPFPIPETGRQVMWNHLAAFTAPASAGKSAAYMVLGTGTPILIGISQSIQDFPFYDATNTGPRAPEAMFWRAKFSLVEPARWAGTQMMLLNPLNQIGVGSRTYFYTSGFSGRAKLMPSLAYDTPVPWSGDTQTMDDIKVFNGSMGRYDFKLIGKKEKFIYSNGFKLTDPKACPPKLVLTKNFPNPDCMRWELHRVWEVEATLKPGFTHAYARRVFYWDEDGYIAGQAENYAADGSLYRIVIGATYPFFEAPGGDNGSTIGLDLKSSMWSAQGIACPDCGAWPLPNKVDDKVFSPEAMAGAGIR